MNQNKNYVFDRHLLTTLDAARLELEAGFAELPPVRAKSSDYARVLQETAARLQDNFPYFHPLYAGQMLKPPHPVAHAAYALAMFVNPNNHALDGGRASSRMEKEAVAEIASMFRWTAHLGHLCGGGTMANMEALWVADQTRPGKVVLASEQAHYTHERISKVLGMRFESVTCDIRGRMAVNQLEERLASGDVGTVVVTLGTTGSGAIDPLKEILALRQQHDFRIHVDAAYGGYFVLADNLDDDARVAFDHLDKVDSLVIDPHKHGLQPYGCGCVLFRNPDEGHFYKHDSPYTYFSSDELHLGEISLECSRPGAAAVALWATQRLLPLMPGGEFANMLSRCRQAAIEFYSRVAGSADFVTAFAPQLDIVIWAPQAESVSEASKKSRAIFKAAADHDLHLALANMPARLFDLDSAGMRPDATTITCLRSVLMKPEHLDWVDEIWRRLCIACDEVG